MDTSLLSAALLKSFVQDLHDGAKCTLQHSADDTSLGGQAGEGGQHEPPEAQQGQGPSPASGNEQVNLPIMCWGPTNWKVAWHRRTCESWWKLHET